MTTTESSETEESTCINCEKFKQVVERKLQSNHDDKPFKAAIFTHAYPDPDALGSMMGMSFLLYKAFGIESDCFYHGEVSHPQNNAMINLLEPTLLRVDEEYSAENYQLNILLDTVPKNAGIGKKEVIFDAVIDHHKDSYINGYKGLFIHIKTGSCASIIYYMMDKLIDKSNWFNDDNELDSRVATAILVGIATDTENMMSADSTELEFDAFKNLFPFRSENCLRDIIFFKRPKSWVEMIALACREVEINADGYAIVGLGLIPEKQRDIVSAVADEMISWASVETSIAFAVVGGEKLVGSVRSNNASISVSELCKRLGGKHGSGGGKLGKGAYNYSLGGMSLDPDEDDDLQQKVWDTYKDKEIKRITKLLQE